jgi:hypothetical protein
MPVIPVCLCWFLLCCDIPPTRFLISNELQIGGHQERERESEGDYTIDTFSAMCGEERKTNYRKCQWWKSERNFCCDAFLFHGARM